MDQAAVEKDDQPFHVLIIGAGAAGLLIGQGLRHAGIKCTIFERSDANTYADRARDWSMGLHWGSEHLNTCLPPEIASQLKYCETDPWIEMTPDQETRIPVCNGRTGKVMAHIQAISSRRVSKGKLKDLLSQGLVVQYGREIVDIVDTGDAKVTAVFADGHNVTGDALVGCDSANSFVRIWLLGKERARCDEMPIIPCNFPIRYSAEQAVWLREQLHPLIKCSPHPDQHTWYLIPTLEVADPDKPETWIFQHFMNLWTEQLPPKTSQERLAHFKALAANYAEPFRSAAAWVPEGTNVPYDRIKQWSKPMRWNNHGGRVTLAGDAAHPFAPHRAQGLNNALRDAHQYVQAISSVLLDGASLDEAIEAYDTDVCERGFREISMSAEQAYATMHWDKYMESPVMKHGHANAK